MARPDTEGGWFKMPLDLDAALAAADFTKGARLVLHEVFLQCHGPARRRSATLPLGELAARWGTHKPHVHRAIAELVESLALRRNDDGSYTFLKDYGSWIRGGRSRSAGQPRLTETELAACRLARPRSFGFGSPDADPIVTHSGNAGADPAPDSEQSSVDPIVTHSGNDAVTPMGNGVTHSGNESLPIRVTPYSEEEERLKTPPTPPPGGSVCVAEASPRRPIATEGWEPADFRRLDDLAEELFPLLEFGRQVGAHAHLYPPAYFEAALRAAAHSNKRVGFAYVLGICRRYAESGGPPPPERSGVGVRPKAPATPIPDYVTAPAVPRKSYTPVPKGGNKP